MKYCLCSYVPSQGDTVVFQALSACPSADLPHAQRWYNHIASFGVEKASFPGSKKDLGSYGSATVSNGSAKKDDDEDDFDLFGSDSEVCDLDLEVKSLGIQGNLC